MRNRATLARTAAWVLVVFLGLTVGYEYGGPALEISPPQCDLGLLPVGRETVGEVTLRNSGWRTLTIQECRSTCGCSRLELSQARIPPGHSAVIRATVHGNTTQRAGVLSFILLKTDARQHREVRIPIVTLGMAGLRLLPDSLDFGAIPAELLPHQVRAKLIVKTDGAKPPIDRFRCQIDDPRLTARLEATQNGDADLVVELASGCPPGDCWTHVTIQEVDGGLSGTFPVHARVLGPHHAIPGTVMLDTGRPKDVSDGLQVTISRRQDGTSDSLSVTDVIVPPTLRDALVAHFDSSNHVILKAVAQVEPAAFQSRIQQSIRIHVHDDKMGDSVIALPVLVTLRPSGNQQANVQ